VASKQLILDPSEYDLGRIIAGPEEIRRYNPQRFEMEQLTAIVYDDVQLGYCVGYKDLTERSFGSGDTCPAPR
jgi:3-hydroxyacyl-[acyl-carrier-protein] dehydratase